MRTKREINKKVTFIDFKTKNLIHEHTTTLGMIPAAALDQGKRVWPAPVFSYLAPARNRTYNILCSRAGTGTYIFIATDTINLQPPGTGGDAWKKRTSSGTRYKCYLM